MDDSDNEINYEHNARTSLSSLLTNYSDIDAINLDASGKVTKIEGGFDFPRTKALLLGLRSVNELSPRALALIHHHLKLNPCDYSVWKFRFECLAVQGKFPGVDPAPQLANAAQYIDLQQQHQQARQNLGQIPGRQQGWGSSGCSESDDENDTREGYQDEWFGDLCKVYDSKESQSDVGNCGRVDETAVNLWELWVTKCMKIADKSALGDLQKSYQFLGQSHKNYQLWNYRRRIAVSAGCAWAPLELAFSQAGLCIDAKHYHSWAHRQCVLRKYGLRPAGGPDMELAFVQGLIEENQRNNSAWSHRGFVMCQLIANTEDYVESEFKFASSAVWSGPHNPCPWEYLLGLVGYFEDSSGIGELSSKEQASFQWLMDALCELSCQILQLDGACTPAVRCATQLLIVDKEWGHGSDVVVFCE